MSVVCDQVGSPTYTADLAPLLCDMVQTENYGTYHATNEGTCSWAEFAEEIFRMAEKDIKVNHIETSEYPARAQRPLNSRLNKDCLNKAGFLKLPVWDEAVRKFFLLNSENVNSIGTGTYGDNNPASGIRLRQ